MKENIYMIPLMDAFNAQDECPFCFLERSLEQHAISFILGSAYMEDDIRMETDKTGFCRHHYKMMFDYGNRLGSALILSTHFRQLNKELKEMTESFTPEKSSLLKRLKKTDSNDIAYHTAAGRWAHEKDTTCYVCNHIKSNYDRYLDTFFEMWKTKPEFREIFSNSKGMCIHHFADIAEMADSKLNEKQKGEFYPVLFRLMRENLARLEDEVTWFTEKYDYRNKDKDWGNSRDSIQRCMQKAAGGYPADPPFQADR